jgi:uncharacterized DUF497 family protein
MSLRRNCFVSLVGNFLYRATVCRILFPSTIDNCSLIHDADTIVRVLISHATACFRTSFRFLMLGISFRLRVLVVCHCFRTNEAVVQIISARKANKKEDANYWNWR